MTQMTEPMTEPTRCPHCGRPVMPYASYCEECGGELIPTRPAPTPQDGAAPDAASGQTRRLGQRASEVAVCPECGGTIDADGYCQTCGTKAPDPRDHEESTPAPWVAGVCDRGVTHAHNEDAMALWADDAAGRSVLVVCDGVSTSTDSDVAARAAARAARAFLTTAFDEPDRVAVMRRTVACANEAVVAHTSPDHANAASATFAAATLDGDRLTFASLGDSRVYWVGESAAILTTDDSMAQEFIAQGMARDAAEALPQAHAITKWLGLDATDLVPDSSSMTLAGPGWVVVCTDGLWNYASGAADLAAVVHDLAGPAGGQATPLSLARGLVAWANARGGHDNVTVAVARHPARRDTLESQQMDGKG